MAEESPPLERDSSQLDICATVPIHFVIAGGIVAMEGNGPLHGAHRHLGKIVLSDDSVAADFTCAVDGIASRARLATSITQPGSSGMAPPDRIVLLAEGLPERVVPFSVFSQFAYLRMPVPSR